MEYKIRIFLVVGSLAAVFADVFILVKYRNNRAQPTGLKIFILEKTFYLGAFIRRILHVSSDSYKRRVRQLTEFYDEYDSIKIALSMTNAPYTYAALFLPLIIPVVVFEKGKLYILIILLLFVFICFYPDIWISMRIKNRNEAILSDFSGMVLKLYMLVSIGIPTTVAFEKVAVSSKGYLYEEMVKVVNDVSLGMSYSDALEGFRERCSCKSVRKFISVYKQNIVLGGPDFPILLNEMVENAFSERKERAKLKGSLASQKLLFPTMIMFIGVLIMVVVPSFENIFA